MLTCMRQVENAEDITAGKKDKSELGIKAVGDYELEIKLTKQTPYFQYLLAFPSFFPTKTIRSGRKWGCLCICK